MLNYVSPLSLINLCLSPVSLPEHAHFWKLNNGFATIFLTNNFKRLSGILLLCSNCDSSTDTYQPRPADHSLSLSTRVCNGRNYNRWSFHCTDKCRWRNERAKVLGHPVHHGDTGGREAVNLQKQICTVRVLCWTRKHRSGVPRGMDSTDHFLVLLEWHIPLETVRVQILRQGAPEIRTSTWSPNVPQNTYKRTFFLKWKNLFFVFYALTLQW